MQFKLKLTKVEERNFLPLNYRYEISKAIVRLLNKGCSPSADKKMVRRMDELRTFTFGDLEFDDFIVHQESGLIEHNSEQVSLEVRFLIDPLEENMIKDLLLYQNIELGDCGYHISQVKSTEAIEFQDIMSYRCLCPLVLRGNDDCGSSNYLSPTDHTFSKSFKVNLIKKVLRSHPEIPALEDLDQYCPEFQFQLLTEPQKQGFKVRTSDDNQVDAIGYQFDFQMKASPILHELGFYEGFGLQHSMGLGFVEVIS